MKKIALLLGTLFLVAFVFGCTADTKDIHSNVSSTQNTIEKETIYTETYDSVEQETDNNQETNNTQEANDEQETDDNREVVDSQETRPVFSIKSLELDNNHILEIEIDTNLTPNSPLNVYTHPSHPTNKSIFDKSTLVQIGLKFDSEDVYVKNISSFIQEYEVLQIYGFAITLCDKEECNFEKIEYSRILPE